MVNKIDQTKVELAKKRAEIWKSMPENVRGPVEREAMVRFGKYRQLQESMESAESMEELEVINTQLMRMLDQGSSGGGSGKFDEFKAPVPDKDRKFNEETNQAPAYRAPSSFGEASYNFIGKMNNVLK